MSGTAPTSISRKPPACFRPISRSWVPSACRPVTLNASLHHTYWILQHRKWSATPKECNLQPFTKPGGNKQIETGLADQQTWPLWAAFWWWQAILPAVHFVAEIQKPSPSCASDPTQRFGLPDHRVFVLVLGCFLFLEVYMNQMKHLLQFHNSHAANYLWWLKLGQHKACKRPVHSRKNYQPQLLNWV